MTTPKKIDGYCAWHPEMGWQKDNYSIYRSGVDISEGAAYGWQIKPILLADAETEVVVPRELVKAICAHYDWMLAPDGGGLLGGSSGRLISERLAQLDALLGEEE